MSTWNVMESFPDITFIKVKSAAQERNFVSSNLKGQNWSTEDCYEDWSNGFLNKVKRKRKKNYLPDSSTMQNMSFKDCGRVMPGETKT